MTVPARRCGLLAAATVPLMVVAGLVPGAPGPASGRTVAAPGLFGRAAASVSARPTTRPAAAGTDRLVSLHTALLPLRPTGRRIALDLPGASYTARITHVTRTSSYTAWTGPIDTSLGSFTMVRVGSVYRGEVSSPKGDYAISSAGGGAYWVTHVARYRGGSGDDVVASSPDSRWVRRVGRPSLARAARAAHHGKARIDVMFAFTSRAKQKAGGGPQIKADAALAITDTNTALSNSHIAVRVHLKGVVHTRNKETTNVFTDVRRLYLPHDGHFDGLLKQKRRHHADIVHLLTGGSRFKLCGAGYEPTRPRYARPSLGVSVSFVSCLPYIVATHELGHNMGADHIKYPGISHDSKLPYAYGHYNVQHRYLSVMSYYDPCTDKKIYDCQRIPYYSSPHNKYMGLSLGNRHQDNSKAIRLIAPLVAKYAHR